MKTRSLLSGDHNLLYLPSKQQLFGLYLCLQLSIIQVFWIWQTSKSVARQSGLQVSFGVNIMSWQRGTL